MAVDLLDTTLVDLDPMLRRLECTHADVHHGDVLSEGELLREAIPVHGYDCLIRADGIRRERRGTRKNGGQNKEAS